MQDSDSQWFIEKFTSQSTCFGLEVERKLHSEQSQYQAIDIYETKSFGRLMVLDGCIMLTDRDNFLYHEMMVHPALFTHPSPKRIAIIGGGDCGTLKEVLKHSRVENATQIEIDERVTANSKQYFPDLCSSNDDTRAQLLFIDGIKWMQECPADSLDVIIIDSTDPVGPAAGLFATDFYRACFSALGETGILVQQTESPLLHFDSIIRKAQNDMLASGFNQVSTLQFPQPVYPSGWWSATMAGKAVETDKFDASAITNKSFSTRYYNLEMHKAALAKPEFMKGLV